MLFKLIDDRRIRTFRFIAFIDRFSVCSFTIHMSYMPLIRIFFSGCSFPPSSEGLFHREHRTNFAYIPKWCAFEMDDAFALFIDIHWQTMIYCFSFSATFHQSVCWLKMLYLFAEVQLLGINMKVPFQMANCRYRHHHAFIFHQPNISCAISNNVTLLQRDKIIQLFNMLTLF